jgi:5-(aminomethyl)-3-furanmethanol phosphate kinase
MAGIHVVKLGGSLLDLSDLPARLNAWMRTVDDSQMLVVVGGGTSADVVREMDKLHKLGEQRSHWLAIRAMEFNAHVVDAVMGDRVGMAGSLGDAELLWGEGKAAVVSPHAWLEQEEMIGKGVGHRWTFTSDSIAGHIAARVEAGRLTMLKSVLPRRDENGKVTAQMMADQRIVDAEFPGVVKGLEEIWVCNLRSDGEGVRVAVD